VRYRGGESSAVRATRVESELTPLDVIAATLRSVTVTAVTSSTVGVGVPTVTVAGSSGAWTQLQRLWAGPCVVADDGEGEASLAQQDAEGVLSTAAGGAQQSCGTAPATWHASACGTATGNRATRMVSAARCRRVLTALPTIHRHWRFRACQAGGLSRASITSCVPSTKVTPGAGRSSPDRRWR
jgi:hypothetical protein